MLSANISKELKNSGISFPSIYRIRPSRDPYCSFKSQHQCQNPLLGLTIVLLSLVYPYYELDILHVQDDRDRQTLDNQARN